MAITYAPSVNFGAKDSLPSNDPSKVIKGSEFSVEFTAIQTAFSLAAPTASPTFTGTVTIASVDINGGNIDGTVIGAATPAAGSFTSLTATSTDATITLTGTRGTGDTHTIATAGANSQNLNISADDSIFLRTSDTIQRVGIFAGGDISFYEDTGTTPKFFWDASAERLGLGTTTPTVNLHISSSNGSPTGVSVGGLRVFETAGNYGVNIGGNGTSAYLQGLRGATTTLGYNDLALNPNGGNVGIGTTSPDESLVVDGGIKIRGTNYLSFTNTSDQTYIRAPGSNILAFGTNTAERMRITSAGNVGIGTSSPDVLLDVGDSDHGSAGNTGKQIQSSQDFSTVYSGSNAATWPGVQIVNHDDTANRTAAGITFVHRSSSSGIAGIQSTSDAGDRADIRFATRSASGVAERVIIDYDGNVGIGTSSPATTLDITKNQAAETGLNVLNSNSSGSAKFRVGYDSSNCYEIFRQGNSANITHNATQSGANIIFQISSTERARIDSSGNLLVGTTTSPSGSGSISLTNKLTAGYQGVLNGFGAENSSGLFYSGGTSNGYVAINSNGSNAPLYISLTSSATATTLINFADTSAGVGSITTNGTTTAYNTSSDARLKENIADAEDAGAKVDAIQVRQFDWKADGSHQDYGMIAQELMTVAPEAVSGDPESDDMMGVDYSKLVPMMLKEIQSLRARVAQLEGA